MDNSAFSSTSSNPSSISSSNSSSSFSTVDGAGAGASADNASLLLPVPAFDSSSHHLLVGTPPMVLAGPDNDNDNDTATPAPDIMPESRLVEPHNLPDGPHDSPAHLVFGSSSSSSSSSMIEDYYRDLLNFQYHDSGSASSLNELLIYFVDNMPSVTVDGEGGGPSQVFESQQSGTGSSLPEQSLHDLDAMEVNDDHMHSEATNVEVIRFNMKREDSIYDGYTWRKYGQKAIKGRKFPRSYYRCAHPGCPIKKHIEFSSEEEDIVTITYIRKHNHH